MVCLYVMAHIFVTTDDSSKDVQMGTPPTKKRRFTYGDTAPAPPSTKTMHEESEGVSESTSEEKMSDLTDVSDSNEAVKDIPRPIKQSTRGKSRAVAATHPT